VGRCHRQSHAAIPTSGPTGLGPSCNRRRWRSWAQQIVQSIGREYEIVHMAAFDVARTLIEHIAFDHYICDMDFPNTHADATQGEKLRGWVEQVRG
jgi:hypothetical protein